jgi:organic hydroperoxide reductase OsmC/OhrA
MQITARVDHRDGEHAVSVCTGEQTRALAVPARAGGGSGVNGGEFLMLALATCYCNDLYREAARLGIVLDAVQVDASATFPGIGLAATDIRYRARVTSSASDADVAALIAHTDAVAEIHNTVRAGVAVVLDATGSGRAVDSATAGSS